MLYTIIPLEIIFAEREDRDQDKLKEVRYGTATVIVRTLKTGEERVERVLSTDPAHFLDDALQPGAPWPPR